MVMLARKPRTESRMKTGCVLNNIPSSKTKDHLKEGEMTEWHSLHYTL